MSENKGKIDRKFDAVVIGGGPAGMSAAVWFDDLGLSVLIVEKAAELGGLMRSIFAPITNYLGREAANGREMSERFAAQLSSRINVKLSAKPAAINAAENFIECGGETIGYGVLVFAAGVRRGMLPAAMEFSGDGILTSGAKERALVQGRRVVIVGGGDAALENALILSEYADAITVVHRRDEFSARSEFVERAAAADNILFVMESELVKLDGDGKLRSVSVLNNTTGEIVQIETDHLLVRIGTEPNSELLRGIVETDERGYIIVDVNCRTSALNIYAAGDVANPLSPTIATAAGMGATAAKTALSELIKS